MSLLMPWIINLHGTPHPDRWLVTIILANAACNALYVGTPYNGNFANSTLVRGQYQSIAENRYGSLEKGLNDGSFSGSPRSPTIKLLLVGFWIMI